MAKDANVKVRINTKQAKSDLRGLNRTAQGAAGGIGGGIRSRIGGSLAAGAAGGFGAAAAVRGVASAGVSDLAGNAFGPTMAHIKNLMFQGVDIESRAGAQAFETLPFRLFDQLGGIPPGTLELFKARRERFAQPLRGRRLAEASGKFSITNDLMVRGAAKGVRAGLDVKEEIEKAAVVIKGGAMVAIDKMGDKILKWFGFGGK